MIYVLCQRAVNAARNFLRDQGGSIIIYTGAFIAVGMGGAALSIDIGRVVLLKTQMQNRADAAALAGAAQLDAKAYAIDRARFIMFDSMKAFTTAGADQAELVLLEANFFAVDVNDKISRGLATDVDNVARFAQAIMQRRALSFFYAPAMNIMTGKTASNFTVLNSMAVAMSDPFICKMQPLMICNPFELPDGTTTDYLMNPDLVGMGLRIKQSGKTGAWEPGNFGLLDLPEDALYNLSGANAVQAALEASEPLGCYAVDTLTTAPGNKTAAVQKGINVRWGLPLSDSTADPSVNEPAPNVMNYYQDDVMIDDPLLSSGNGVWNLSGYWALNHPGVPLPLDLTGASRYQIYLFEQGVDFWKGNGKKTTAIATEPADAGSNWKKIAASDYPDAGIIPAYPTDVNNNDRDGFPPEYQPVSPQGYKRRLMKIAVVNCIEHDFNGLASIPGDGVFIEYFLTQQAGTSSEGAAIYGELVGGIEARTSVEFHGNVRLTE